MSNPQPINPPQALSQYSVDWNNVALQAITAGLDQIPFVGGILSHLVFAFWPPSGEDVWAEIKQKVEALINQSISQDDYDRVQAELGSAKDSSGLVGVLQSYLHSVSTNNNKLDPQTTWTDAHETFINAQSAFQQKGIELLLLPLFAQFANMHLSLLRDGVQRGWITEDRLQFRIQSYSDYAHHWYQSGYSTRAESNQGFNYLNEYVQAMQVSVMNFRETWPYFDPTIFPPPVKVAFTNQTYFTITGSLGRQSADYTLPAIPTGQITNIDVYWLQDLNDDYNFVLGTQVNYAGTQEPYTGVLVNGGTPPIEKPCDPNNDYYCYFKNSAAVSPDNPVVAVQGVYDTGGGTYSVNFTFKNESSTGQIPGQNQQYYPTSYNIAPPSGYYLSSVWVPPDTFFYGSAVDMVFGFRYVPPGLDQATAHALYVSSLQPISQDDPRFAPFAAVAASENWEGQRQQFLSMIEGAAKP
jgi:hypothetical protein